MFDKCRKEYEQQRAHRIISDGNPTRGSEEGDKNAFPIKGHARKHIDSCWTLIAVILLAEDDDALLT